MVIEPAGNCDECPDPIAKHNENGCHVFTGDHCCGCTKSYPITVVHAEV